MRHYLNDGKEKIEVSFNLKDVENYKMLVSINEDSLYVPPLYIAKFWPKFKIFSRYINKEILLRETEVNSYKGLKVDIPYNATLYKETSEQLKKYKLHTFCLMISKDKTTYLKIKQTFVEKSEY